MNFIIDLLVLVKWKSNSYDAILVKFDQLIKMIYYKIIKTTIDVLGLVKVIINMVVKHYNFSKLIINDCGLLKVFQPSKHIIKITRLSTRDDCKVSKLSLDNHFLAPYISLF